MWTFVAPNPARNRYGSLLEALYALSDFGAILLLNKLFSNLEVGQ
jgi:hypothetical protein